MSGGGGVEPRWPQSAAVDTVSGVTLCNDVWGYPYTVFMPLTLGDVIDLPEVQQGLPQTLSRRHWHEPIRCVHVGEVADLSSLLQGGEPVLTTGAGLAAGPPRYLRRLADARALGVVV